MNQDLANFVRSKDFPENDKFDLFEILRRDNIVEGLIDYISETRIAVIEDYEDTIYGLKDRIKDLEREVEENEGAQEALDELEEKEELKADTLTGFLDDFIGENNRHPSIEEVWEAAWNGCYEKMKKEEKK